MGAPLSSLPPHLQQLVREQAAADRRRGFDGDYPALPEALAAASSIRGRAARREPGHMNTTETAYAQHLETLRIAGEIQRWDFEPEKLRLAGRTFYEPDFRVVARDGSIEFHEVKGHWEDDARVKIKVAAAQHPYRFLAVHRKDGRWIYGNIA